MKSAARRKRVFSIMWAILAAALLIAMVAACQEDARNAPQPRPTLSQPGPAPAMQPPLTSTPSPLPPAATLSPRAFESNATGTPREAAPVAAILIALKQTATPRAPISGVASVTQVMTDLLIDPPYSLLYLDPTPAIAHYDAQLVDLPPDFEAQEWAMSRNGQLWAVAGVDPQSGHWDGYGPFQLYLIELPTGTTRLITWEGYDEGRPVQDMIWIDNDTLVFAQWMSPRGGQALALNAQTRQVVATGSLVSPEVPTTPIAGPVGAPLTNDPRTPVPPVLEDPGPGGPYFTPDDPIFADLVKKGQPLFRVNGYTFALAEHQWIDPYMVRLWVSDTYWAKSITISARGQPTTQIDAVWDYRIYERPGILGEGTADIAIIAGPPTMGVGAMTSLYALAHRPELILQSDFSLAPGEFRDLDSDGVYEFVAKTAPCPTCFCPATAPALSETVFRYTPGHGFVSDNPSYGPYLAQGRAANERLASAEQDQRIELDNTKKCALYGLLIDYLNLGQIQEARRALEKHYPYQDREAYATGLLNVRLHARTQEPGDVVQRLARLRQRQVELPHVPHARVYLQSRIYACRSRQLLDTDRIAA